MAYWKMREFFSIDKELSLESLERNKALGGLGQDHVNNLCETGIEDYICPDIYLEGIWTSVSGAGQKGSLETVFSVLERKSCIIS